MCICITESHKKILLFEIKKKSPMYGSFKITPSFTILSAYIIRKTTTWKTQCDQPWAQTTKEKVDDLYSNSGLNKEKGRKVI